MTNDLIDSLGPAPTWIAGAEFAALSGLGRIEAFRDGVVPLPPAYLLVGMRAVDAGVGCTRYELASSGWLADDAGWVDTAALAYFADAPIANAVHSMLPSGETLRSVTLSMQFLERVPLVGSPIVAAGTGENRAGVDALARLRISTDDRLVATATQRAIVIDHPAGVQTDLPAREGSVPERLGDPEGCPPSAGPGLDRLQSMIDRTVCASPFWRLTGFQPSEVEVGRAVLTARAHGWLTSPADLLYGGALSSLAMAALEAAMWTADQPGERTRPLDLTYNFTRGVAPDGAPVVAESHLVHRGRTMAIADVEIRDAQGRRVGIGRSTGLVEERMNT